MPITVLSPFSGRPVKVRDQDVGRAVRDEEGRIFYVVARSDGTGYYGSPTRKGSEKDEQRYTDLETKTATTAAQVKAEHAAVQPHDATGPGRQARPLRWLILLLVLLLAAAGVYIAVNGTDDLPFFSPPNRAPAPPSNQAPAEPAPDAEPDADEQPASRPEESPARSKPSVSREAIALLMGRGGKSDGHEKGSSSPPLPAVASPKPPPATRVDLDPLEAAKRRITESLDQAKPFTRTASGLRYRVEEEGDGGKAVAGRFVVIHYTAALYHPDGGGRVIDSTRGGAPLGFVLWTGQVIRGWDEGIAGMREGERRILIIPADLAGATGRTPAHGNLPRADLLCEVELVEVRPGVRHVVDRVGAGQLAYPGDTVELHYTATIDGKDKPFDDSRAHGQPLRMTIGAGEVITGLELGVTGMAEGEKRTIEIPAHLAYGSRGAGSLIPPDSDLTYRVELLRIIQPNG